MTNEIPPPETTPAKHHRGGLAWSIAIAALLTLMLALPGFVSGIYSRFSGERLFDPLSGTSNRAINAFCWPAYKLARTSPAIYQFYRWEFEVAGGRYIILDD